ncbi:hypothetical protein ACFOG5_22030 [Pedobacter fastidiosus]
MRNALLILAILLFLAGPLAKFYHFGGGNLIILSFVGLGIITFLAFQKKA